MYPPVDTDFYRPEPAGRSDPGFLVVSALVPYKRLDIAIAASAAAGVPLTIVGRGPEEARLRAMAGPSVTFTGWLSDDEIRARYRRATAVLMPGVEDFGMVPVEAMACGRPVVALAEGGALDSVEDGLTGLLVRDPTVDAFARALREAQARDWDEAAIRRHAETFSKPRFQREFSAVVDDALGRSGPQREADDARARQ